MPPQKKPPKPKTPPINHATTGRPTTPSGSGVVLGASRPKNGTKKGTRVNMANPAKDKNWWEGAANRSHEQHDMMLLSAGLHNLADSLYRPVGTDTGRGVGKSSGLEDRRLHESSGNANQSRGKANGEAGTATKFSQRTTSRKMTASRLPNGRRGK